MVNVMGIAKGNEISRLLLECREVKICVAIARNDSHSVWESAEGPEMVTYYPERW